MAIDCSASALSAASECFRCALTPKRQSAAQTYLLAKIAVASGAITLANSTPAALVAAASCLDCAITPKLEKAAQIPPLCILAGQTDCTPAALLAAAECLDCALEHAQQVAAQTYLLAQIALDLGAISSATPSAIAAASTCYDCAVTPKLEHSIQLYLLCQLAFVTQCASATPETPTDLTPMLIGANDMAVGWTQPAGVAVDHWVVSWGTSSGVYTNSATTTSNPYQIFGLTQSTTYFIVVRAFSADGCPSDLSAELEQITNQPDPPPGP